MFIDIILHFDVAVIILKIIDIEKKRYQIKRLPFTVSIYRIHKLLLKRRDYVRFIITTNVLLDQFCKFPQIIFCMNESLLVPRVEMLRVSRRSIDRISKSQLQFAEIRSLRTRRLVQTIKIARQAILKKQVLTLPQLSSRFKTVSCYNKSSPTLLSASFQAEARTFSLRPLCLNVLGGHYVLTTGPLKDDEINEIY